MAETTRASRPIFSRAANSKSVQSYLAQLDELLKRNKGGFSSVAEDTGSSIPFQVPGRAVKSGVRELPQERKLAELPAPEEYPVQVLPPQEGEVLGQQGSGMSASDFIDSLYQSLGVQDSLYLTGQGSSPDGGTILSDGSVAYSDGTLKTNQGETIYAMGSVPGGGLLYSDGSYRYIDPTTPGLEGLMSALGLTGQAITQPYGNINPVEPTPGNVNMGTDIRTKNLPSKAFSLPFETKVLQVYQDDGVRDPSQSATKGYGNSVLLQLPTGEAIRLSHLSMLGNVQAGQTLAPGSLIGVAGQTGNAYGEHLDLEFYNKDGQLTSPEQFSGFTNPQEIKAFVQSPTIQPSQSPASAPQAPQSPQPAQSLGGMDKLNQAVQQAGLNAANFINQQNPTGKYGAGITETLQGNRPAAIQEQSQTLEALGTAVGAPELQTGELSRQQQTNPLRQLAGNLVDVASTPLKKVGLPDLGVSEAIAGGKTVNTDVNLAPQAGAYDSSGTQIASKQPTPQDYASVLGQNISSAGKYIGEQAGAGIDKLKNSLGGIFSKGGASANLFSKPSPNSLAGQRAVGDVSGGSLLPTAVSDVRNAQAASRAGQSSVLGAQAPDTSSQELDSLRKAYMDRYGDAHAYDQADLQRKLANLKPGDTLQSIGEPALTPQFRQEEQQRISGEQARVEAERQGYIPAGTNYGVSAPQKAPTPGTVSGGQKADSSGWGSSQEVSNGNLPPVYINNQPVSYDFATYGKTTSAQPASAPKPQNNLFSTAVSTVNNLFKKWFQ